VLARRSGQAVEMVEEDTGDEVEVEVEGEEQVEAP
jgi:hypothetical protein